MSEEEARRTRQASTIEFPYVHLDEAIGVARVMLDAGGVPLDRYQLAAALGQTPSGGAFNNKMAAAKMFGLVDSEQGRFALTPLGFDILDASRERASKSEAFLNVELFKKTFETYRGKQLPPRPFGLEQAFVNFGVTPKQRETARRVFERSARSAGFFSNDNEDRLVQPIIGLTVLAEFDEPTPSSPQVPTVIPTTESVARALGPSFVPAHLAWLIAELPQPKAEWDLESQADWLRAAAQGFRIAFKSDPKRAIFIEIRDLSDKHGG